MKHCGFMVFVSVLLLLGFLPEQQLQHLELHTYEHFSYRWLSAHFIHLGLQHAVMNVAGAIVVWLLCVSIVPTGLLLVMLLLLPVGVSLGLVMTDSGMSYRGFSGAIEGFLVVGIIWHWWLSRRFSLLLGALVAGKLIIEQMPSFDNTYLLDSIGGLVAVDAHLYGVGGGLFLALVYLVLAYCNVPCFCAPWRMPWARSRHRS
ncbi:rhombosortase [Marinagarivorans algicola]|uniref:rhombosortase n=2 Tax=Marinagarivorans algicola TaxID=1513270 RepID=UPI0006B489E7|nr:rhombosortase [Marinagarivorans algicola]